LLMRLWRQRNETHNRNHRRNSFSYRHLLHTVILMMVKCHVCDGDGKVEVPLAADEFRDDDCDLCDGSGKLKLENEDE